MGAEEILAAREAGQLADLLAGKDPIKSSGARVTPADDGPPQHPGKPEPRPQVVPQSSVATDDRRTDASGDAVSREQLHAMSPEEIMQAYEDGRLDRLKRTAAANPEAEREPRA